VAETCKIWRVPSSDTGESTREDFKLRRPREGRIEEEEGREREATEETRDFKCLIPWFSIDSA
tara:strand:- start:309 stop:497 length:189 start_codon:yes stop_codon:yes gene_type:complete